MFNKVKNTNKVASLEFFREFYNQPTANIFKVAENLVKSSVDTAFGATKKELPSVELILDCGTVIKPLFVNEKHVFFSMVSDVDTLKIDDDCTYTTYNKKGVNYVFSNDENIIKICLTFFKFNME